MTIEQRNNNCVMHKKVCDELQGLYRKKNHDYGDSFHKSYEEFGLTMAAIRLDDKLNRFKNLIKEESEVKNESSRDTLIDLANYAIMTVMELDMENPLSGKVFLVKCRHCGFYGDVPGEKADVNLLNNSVACPQCGQAAEMSV